MEHTKLLMVGLVFGFFLFVPQSVQADWWNTSWSKKAPVNVWVASGETETEFSLITNITYDSDMNLSFKDIRFVDTDDSTEIYSCLIDKADSGWARFGFKSPDPINTTNRTFYMYYGNPTAENISDLTQCNATFEFFDGFDRSDSATVGNNWNELDELGGTMNISNNMLRLNDTTNLQNVELKHMFNSSLDNYTIQFPFLCPDPEHRMYMWADNDSDPGTRGTAIGGFGLEVNLIKLWADTRVDITSYIGNTDEVEATFEEDPENVSLYVVRTDNSSEGDFDNILGAGNVYGFSFLTGTGTFADCYIDWVLLKKYHDPEPLVYLGDEEEPESTFYLDAKDLLPTTPDTLDNLEASCTCVGDGLLTCYVQMWNGSDAFGVVESDVVSNDTNTNFYNLSFENTTRGENWKAEIWCGNTTINTSSENTSVRTIQNSVPQYILNSPADAATGVTLNPYLNLTCIDHDLGTGNVSFYNITVGAESYTLNQTIEHLSGSFSTGTEDMGATYDPVNDTFWIIGGDDGSNYKDWVRQYNKSADTISKIGKLPDVYIPTQEGCIYSNFFNHTICYGGLIGAGKSITDKVIFFNSSDNTTGYMNPVLFAPAGFACTAYDSGRDISWTLGGYYDIDGDSYTEALEVMNKHNHTSDTITNPVNMTKGLFAPGCAYDPNNDHIVIVGGTTGENTVGNFNRSNKTYIFFTNNETIIELGTSSDFPIGDGQGADSLSCEYVQNDSNIYCFGGISTSWGGGLTYYDDVMVFFTENQTWYDTGVTLLDHIDDIPSAMDTTENKSVYLFGVLQAGSADNDKTKMTETERFNVTNTITAANTTTLMGTTSVSNGSFATYQWSGLSENTKYYWYVIIDDGTDTNQSISNWSFTTTSDSVPPVVTLPIYTNATQAEISTNITLNISVVDNKVESGPCLVSIGSGANQTVPYLNNWCNGTIDLTGATEGNQTIYAWGNDTLSNWGLNDSYVVWITDSSLPNITVFSPTNTTYIIRNITLNVAANKLIDTWWYNLNGGSNVTFTPNTTFLGEEGSNTITVYANDTGGVENSSTIIFAINTSSNCTGGYLTATTDLNVTFDISGSQEVCIQMPKNATFGYFTVSDVTLRGYQINSTGYTFDSEYSLDPQYPEGLDSNDTHFFVLSDPPASQNVSRYNTSFVPDGFSFSPTNDAFGTYTGIAFNGSHYFITGSEAEIGVYDNTGSLITTYDISAQIPGLADTSGIDEHNNTLYVVDFDADKIFGYFDNGTYNGFNFDVTTETTDPSSVMFNGNYFFVLDQSNGNVYIYNSTGSYLSEIINPNYPADFGEANGLYHNLTEVYVSGDTTGNSPRVWKFNGMFPTNITADTGSDDVDDFSMTGVFSYNETIDLNTTAIINYLDGCLANDDGYCYVPINATTYVPGILEFSNLNITYNLSYPLITCGGISNTTALIMTTYREENNTVTVLSDWEAEFDLSSEEYGYINNITFDVDNSTNLSLCIYPSNAVFDVSGTVKYSNNPNQSVNYSTRYYFFQNAELDNVTDDIYLYLLEEDDSSQITFVVKNIYNALQSDIIVKATRFFISDDVYRQVDMGLSDFDGEATMQLKLNEWYIFIIEQNGVILRTLPQKFLIDTDDVEIFTETGTYVEYFEYYDTVGASCSVDNTTQLLTCTFSDTSGKMVQLNLTIERRQLVGGFTTVCTNTTTASSGTLSCSYSGYNNTELNYHLTGRFCCSDETFWTILSGYIMPNVSVFFGLTGVVIMIFILITSIMFGYWNPVIPIITGIFALIIGSVLNLIVLPVFALGSLAIAGGIIIYKMRT